MNEHLFGVIFIQILVNVIYYFVTPFNVESWTMTNIIALTFGVFYLRFIVNGK